MHMLKVFLYRKRLLLASLWAESGAQVVADDLQRSPEVQAAAGKGVPVNYGQERSLLEISRNPRKTAEKSCDF